MFYKVTRKSSAAYKKLHALRTRELQIDKDNKKAIKEKTGLDYQKYFGTSTNQTFTRTLIYSGFVFKNPEKVDTKTWKRDSNLPDVFVSNTRYKLGREIREFLQGLPSSNYSYVLEAASIEEGIYGKFTIPYMEICCDIILLFLDDKHIPTDPNIIEITSKEFEAIRDQHFKKKEVTNG
ncbi:hypothetical protein [Mongoliibacter ruber]|uniref:Uncharacterized protein n=1 Tax=Mongoliibacter ruber TaxID=1750599 RepID=A0A2T0WV85_9BACT|nr:hypothetical protein [Mongoliibacter ruber]PRY90611.1 hypothetical protein CLW00_101275 [Mongoliibacter ruber]